METYEPELDSPYPDEDWSEITAFEYRTPLHLYRAIESVQRREGKDADYILWRDYSVRYRLDEEDEFREITVPGGMLTDLASVPSVARSVVGRVGPHLEASVVHDFLYIAWQDVDGRGARDEDREFADKLMRVAMEKAGVSGWKRFIIYNAVRTFGGGTYRREDNPRYVKIPGEAVAMHAENARMFQNALTAWSQERSIIVSLQAQNLIRIALESITADPHPAWADRSETERREAQSDYIKSLGENLSALQEEENVADRLTTYHVLHWLSRSLDSICVFEK